jgi:hypothetical protein
MDEMDEEGIQEAAIVYRRYCAAIAKRVGCGTLDKV